jgi:hypothetical protein
MAKPWEKYQSKTDGPWSKYGKSEDSPAEKEYDYSNLPKDLVKGQVDALPMYGQMAGSMFGPIAAGAGQAAGASLRDGLYGVADLVQNPEKLKDELRLPTAEQVAGIANKSMQNFNEGVVMAGAGEVVDKGLQVAAPIVSAATKKVTGKISDKAKDGAQYFAARALGAERGSIKKLGQDKVDDAAQYALDNGLLTPLGSTDDVIARNAAKQAEGGKAMGKVYDKIDDAGASTFSPTAAADEVEKELGTFWRSALNKSSTNQFDNTLEAIRMRAGGSTGAIPLNEAQILKEELGKAANWKKASHLDITEKEQIARDAYRIVSKQIDDAVEAGAKALGSDDLLSQLQQGKRLYGNSKSAGVMLENKAAREAGNKPFPFGLTDTITGVGAAGYGSATGDWETAAGVMAAKKGLEKFGAQNAALALNKVSKALAPAAKGATQAPKVAQVAQGLAHSFKPKPEAPQMPLQKAAENQQQNEAGVDKWIQKGAEKLKGAGITPEVLKSVKESKSGQMLLIKAGDAKNPEALSAVVEQIKQTEEYKKNKPLSKSDFPRKITRGEFEAVVKNQMELDEAKSEGWA